MHAALFKKVFLITFRQVYGQNIQEDKTLDFTELIKKLKENCFENLQKLSKLWNAQKNG
jgi:hypothetical protein